MRISSTARLSVLITIATILTACTPTSVSVEEFVPSPSPTISPTDEPTQEPTEELLRSPYFNQVTLLETTNLPLTPGDEAYFIRSSVMHDMNDDGVSDAIFTVATYPENMSHPIVILNGAGPVENIAEEVFLDAAVPSIIHSNQIFFADINNDGRQDLLVSEAGNDKPPWFNPDAMIGIGVNRGGGNYVDVSATVPEAAIGLRNYPLAAGDLYNDGVVRIVLPSQAIMGEDPNYYGPDRTGLLFWSGSAFEFQQNWIDMGLWWWPENLYTASYMEVIDLDDDGFQDLYLTGNWTTPNHRVLFGTENFPWTSPLVELPEGPYGHTPWETFQLPDVDMARGADISRAVIEDFDGDGDLDIVSISEEVLNFKPGVFDDENLPWYDEIFTNGGTVYTNVWFQVLRNDGQRQFVDIENQGRDLGLRYYIALDPIDIDLDGDLDLLGTYWSKSWLGQCVPKWGSTFFINQGDLVFETVEDSELFPELEVHVESVAQWPDCGTLGLGVLFPTDIEPEGMTGLFVVPVDLAPNRPELRVFRFETAGLFQFQE
jgi:hypothetical protein